MYEELAEDDNEDEEGAEGDASEIKEVFFSENAMVIIFDKGKFAGQTIYVRGKRLSNGLLKLYIILAEQISTVTQEQILSGFKDIETIRKIPDSQSAALRHILNEYSKANPGKIELIA